MEAAQKGDTIQLSEDYYNGGEFSLNPMNLIMR